VRYLLVLSGHRHLCVTYIEPAVHRTVAGDSISSSFIAELLFFDCLNYSGN